MGTPSRGKRHVSNGGRYFDYSLVVCESSGRVSLGFMDPCPVWGAWDSDDAVGHAGVEPLSWACLYMWHCFHWRGLRSDVAALVRCCRCDIMVAKAQGGYASADTCYKLQVGT
jgi:hypothetical protein